MARAHPIYSFQQFSFQCAICTLLFAGNIALGCVRRVGDAIKKRAGVFPIEPSSLAPCGSGRRDAVATCVLLENVRNLGMQKSASANAEL